MPDTASRWSQRRLRLAVFASGFGLANFTGDVVRSVVSSVPDYEDTDRFTPFLVLDLSRSRSPGWSRHFCEGRWARGRPQAQAVPSLCRCVCHYDGAAGRSLAAITRMKSIIAFFICCFALLQADAADQPLIPTPLNSVLLKVQLGMSTNQVLAVLSPSYPKVTGQTGTWSGQTGYCDYKLDERFTLAVASVMRDGKELVHDDLLFYVFDWQTKRRVDIKLYYWEGQSHKDPPKK